MISINRDALKSILPPSIKNDRKIKALAYAWDKQMELIINDIEQVLIFPRIDILQDEILTELAKDLHVDFWSKDWDIEVKRFFVKNAFIMHRQRGTLGDLRYAIDKALPGVIITETNDSYRFKVEAPQDIAGEAIDMALVYKNVRSQILYNMTNYENDGNVFAGMLPSVAVKINIDLRG